jgi:hypothetical protein
MFAKRGRERLELALIAAKAERSGAGGKLGGMEGARR